MHKFKTNAELDAYFDGDKVQCLECGQWFKNLGKHVRMHDMTPNDYRDKWAIPRCRALAGQMTRKTLSRQANEMWEDGVLDGKHLSDAAKNIDYKTRTSKKIASNTQQKHSAKKSKPWDTHRIEPGGKRGDGRDADRAREYQRAYRAFKSGNSKPMAAYKQKYGIL